MKKTSKKTSTKTVRENRTNKKSTASVEKTKPATKSLPDLRDDRESKNTTHSAIPIVMMESEKMSQGGMGDYSEAEDSVERVHGEFISDHFKPKITLAYKTMRFNMACVNLFPDCQYVAINIDWQKRRRLYVVPAMYYDNTSFKFANFNSKIGKNVPRPINTKYFCQFLFEFMKWDPNAKYRILTIFHVFGDKKVLLFNLDDSLQVFSETIETEDGKKKRRTTPPIFPLDWKGRFGHTIGEYAEKRRLDFSNEVVTIDEKTGEVRVGNIEPMPPTPENLIHEQYGGIRTRKEEKKDD
jgi:hypothetical protein